MTTRRLALIPGLLLLAGAPLGAPTAVAGQLPEIARAPAAHTGWIGISVEFRGAVEASGARRSLVEITEVRPDGPAARAGLRAGDVLLSLNGRSPENGFAEMVGPLEPGDPVVAVVRRDGQERRFRFEAGARPRGMGGPSTYTVLIEADTLADRMYRAMDSLRVRIATRDREGGAYSTVRITRTPDGVDTLVTVFGRPLAPGETPVDADALRRLRAASARGAVFLDTLGRAHRVASEERRPFRLLFLHEDSTSDGGPAEPVVTRFRGEAGGEVAEVTLRPLAPYALGRNRAAGAEIVELKPELAEYFAVERGVLVVDVAPGTPAARAGLQPGDVLTRIGTVPVGSVAEVRASFAQPRDSLAVHLVRKGEPMELLLRR